MGTIPIIPDLEGRRVLVTGAELHQDTIVTIGISLQLLTVLRSAWAGCYGEP